MHLTAFSDNENEYANKLNSNTLNCLISCLTNTYYAIYLASQKLSNNY